MSLKRIKAFLEDKPAKLQAVSGIGLDFKCLYIETDTGYVFTLGGANYAQAFKKLTQNTDKLYK